MVNLKQLKEFRRTLHANPEVAGNEIQTAKRVYDFLLTCDADEIITEVGGHGIIATWDSGNSGNEILFRAELDALPIEEINTFAHKSTVKGVSHKCGHDGHTTILCGLAQHLKQNKPAKGKVRLIFQPAEENGMGVKAMLHDEIFDVLDPDYVFALHNLPGYALKEVVVKDNTFTAAVNSIIINLKGKTSHAAEPEHGFNPALAIAEILQESLALQNNNPAKEDMRVITPVFLEMGEKAYGISAGSGSIHLTIRCWNDDNLAKLEADIRALSIRIAKKYHLKESFEFTQTFYANINHVEAANFVRSAVNQSKSSSAKAELTLTEREFPFKWGEDFGLFTSRYKGCMFGLGSGINTPALHNPDYDFQDDLIQTGVSIFSEIINQINKP